MKIAFFFDEPEYFGGAGSLLLKQAKLMSRIHEVLVVIPENNDGVENIKCAYWCDKEGLRHLGLKYKTSFNFRDIDLLDAVKRVDSICRLISEENIDFLHSAQLNIAVELAGRKMNIPHLMNIYKLREEEFLLKQSDIYAKYHLCDSKLYSTLWSRKMNIVSEYIRPLSPLEVKKQGKVMRKSKYNVLMLGLVYQGKNQLAAIKAIEKLRGRIDLQLIIAGDYDNVYGKMCVDYVKEHKLENNVTFLGFVMDVKKLFENSDWFLTVSMNESFPSAIVEAVSYGLPIIATPVAGVPEVFVNGTNAFVSSGFSQDEIICSIQNCYDACEDGSIVNIQQNADCTWNDEFSLDVNFEKMNHYYNRIISDFNNSEKKQFKYDELLKEVTDTGKYIALKCDDAESLVSKSFYYNYLLKNISLKNIKKAYIWGAGKLGKLAYDFLTSLVPEVEIVGFLDNNKEGIYLGVPIRKFEEVKWDVDNCLVFIAYGGDIWGSVEKLEKAGFVFADNIWIIQ